MAISTYAELKTTMSDWLNRTDMDAVLPTFITLAEAIFNRELRLASQITTATLSIVEGAAQLPADYLEIERIGECLDYRSPELFDAKERGTFTIEGKTIRVSPTDTRNLELVYYARIPALSDTNPANELLTAHPDLYLYASLAASAPYLKEDARLATWAGVAQQIMAAVRVDDESRRFSGTTLRMIAPVTFG